MKLFVLLLIIFSNILSAYDIDQILDLYRKDSDLSKKTKDESLGHLTVYTRDDLERMQAYTLSDLLDSLRSFRYDENMLGMPDVLHVDPSLYSSDIVKIFINDHEISSAFTGSGFYLYGNIDLGFVDHVEIYEGSASTYVTTGLSVVTIKLYSKDPTRERGGHLQVNGGSRGSHYENISYAGIDNDFKYYLYASHKKTNREKYEHDKHTLSRDYKDQHALMTLSYKNLDLGAEILEHKMDPFLSLSMFATPKDGDINYLLKRLSATMTFLDDDSLKFSATFIRVNTHMNLNMNGTRWTIDRTKLDLSDDSLLSDSVDDTYKVKLEKKVNLKKHHLVIGTEYLQKDLHDVVVYNAGILDTTPDYVNDQIVSAYVQDDYALYKNQIITASVKYNHYNSRSDKANRVFDTTQYRVGYIVTSRSEVFKAFASQMELPTEQYALDSTPQTSIELLKIRDYSAEYSKRIKAHKIGICYEYLENENPLFIREKGSTKYYNNNSVSLKYEYKFDPFNSLKSMIYYNQYHSRITTVTQKVEGGFVRLLNSWKKFDFYNEADYYHLRNSAINGIEFNTGIRYKATTALIFTFKGVNIFNTAAESQYDYVNLVNGTPELKSLYIPPVDSSFTVGMEYDF
jgi:iron complex outermembrane receptor protein